MKGRRKRNQADVGGLLRHLMGLNYRRAVGAISAEAKNWLVVWRPSGRRAEGSWAV